MDALHYLTVNGWMDATIMMVMDLPAKVLAGRNRQYKSNVKFLAGRNRQ
jgi:hypothetical protein